MKYGIHICFLFIVATMTHRHSATISAETIIHTVQQMLVYSSRSALIFLRS